MIMIRIGMSGWMFFSGTRLSRVVPNKGLKMVVVVVVRIRKSPVHETGSHVPESTPTLLVHLGTRGNTINSHKENLSWLYHSKQHLSQHAEQILIKYAYHFMFDTQICLTKQYVSTTVNKQNKGSIKETCLNVVENISKDLFFCNSKMWIFIFGVWTDMNNSIHIQIQIVKFWKLKSCNAQVSIIWSQKNHWP